MVCINGLEQVQVQKDSLTKQAERAAIEGAQASRKTLGWTQVAAWAAIIGALLSLASIYRTGMLHDLWTYFYRLIFPLPPLGI